MSDTPRKPPARPTPAAGRPPAKPVAPVRPLSSKAPVRPAVAPRAATPALPAGRPGAPPKAAVAQPKPSAVKPPPARLLDAAQIYFVTSPIDPTALLARRAGVDDGLLHWDDTGRDRARRVLASEAREGGVVWVKTEGDVEYLFTPLTLELYDRHVRAKVELSPPFPSTEALLHFYRTTSFD